MTELQYKRGVYTFNELKSTNSMAEKIARLGNWEEGVIINTLSQPMGRGQKGNSWVTDPGKNLTFSLIIKPDFLPLERHFYLSVITSLSLVDLLKENGIEASVKWPNDIYLGDLKVAGILIENSIQGPCFRYSVIGIGLNVNQEHFPVEIPNPVSLWIMTGKKFNINSLLERWRFEFDKYYDLLKNFKLSQLMDAYHQKLYLKSVKSEFATESHRFTGTILGVNDQGLLAIQDEQGAVRQFAFKEVEYLRK